MDLTPQEEKEYAQVDAYVRQYAKTWFMENKQKWNSAVTILMDLQEYGSTAEDSIRKLVNRVFGWREAREKIIDGK